MIALVFIYVHFKGTTVVLPGKEILFKFVIMGTQSLYTIDCSDRLSWQHANRQTKPLY